MGKGCGKGEGRGVVSATRLLKARRKAGTGRKQSEDRGAQPHFIHLWETIIEKPFRAAKSLGGRRDWDSNQVSVKRIASEGPRKMSATVRTKQARLARWLEF